MIYWRRYGGDYLVSTIGFTMEMDGAYGRLLDTYYEREGPLPADEVLEIARATKPSDVEAVRKVLALKFRLRAGHYHHERADAEIALAQTARDNGGKHVGKSGKVTGKRTAKRARKVTGTRTEDMTGTTTGNGTGQASQDATHRGHPYNRTTLQPSSPSTNTEGEEHQNLRQGPPLLESEGVSLPPAVRDMPFPDDEPHAKAAQA